MKRNVFLSFTTEDKEVADLFRSQMETRQPGVAFRNYSIKEAFEQTWKTNAERLIRACSATICLIGKTTHRSRAVDWEVRKSAELDRRVMAVSIQPTETIVVPSALVELKVKPLSWDMERIAGELNGIGTEHSRTGAFRRACIDNDLRRCWSLPGVSDGLIGYSP